jgi:hypothetical protein
MKTIIVATRKLHIHLNLFAVLVCLTYLTGCAMRGYEVVAEQQHATIARGEVLRLVALCPEGKHVIGGGGHVQWMPVGSAANYTLKSSSTANVTPNTVGPRRATGWSMVWTNATDIEHPQVVTFTIEAICAYTD